MPRAYKYDDRAASQLTSEAVKKGRAVSGVKFYITVPCVSLARGFFDSQVMCFCRSFSFRGSQFGSAMLIHSGAL